MNWERLSNCKSEGESRIEGMIGEKLEEKPDFEFLMEDCEEDTSLEFVFDWPHLNYALDPQLFLYKEESRHNFTLSAFTQFFKSCDKVKLPSVNFAFVGGTLDSDDLQEFLQVHGKSVRGLNLHVFCPPPKQHWVGPRDYLEAPGFMSQYVRPGSTRILIPTPKLLNTLLTVQAPNLRHFELSHCPLEWTQPNELLFSHGELQELSTSGNEILRRGKLVVGPNVPEHIVHQLLQASQKLHSTNFSHAVLKANKFHLVQHLEFVPVRENIQSLERFTKTTKSHLTSFIFASDRIPEFPPVFPTISRIVTNILEASSSTLANIEWRSPVGFLRDLKIPALPSLTAMTFETSHKPEFLKSPHCPYPLSQFPHTFQISHSCPSLYGVTISTDIPPSVEQWSCYHRNYSPSHSVRVLILEGPRIPSGWLSKYAQLFPNLQDLLVDVPFLNLPNAANGGLWSFSRLKSLRLKLNWGKHHEFPSLDSAFTGFSIGTCLSLAKSCETLDGKRLKALRQNPSILQLKDLETLRIIVVDRSTYVRDSYPTILTHVAGKYAFQMCPKLQVILEYEIGHSWNRKPLQESLNHFREFVTESNLW